MELVGRFFKVALMDEQVRESIRRVFEGGINYML